MRYFQKKSFTLLELLIVVVVLTILATFAIPGYLRVKQKTVDQEARSQLKLIQTAEKSYCLEEGQYITCANNADCKTKLRLDLPPATPNGNWNYRVINATNTVFKANATGTSGTTNWTIDEDDVCAYGADGQYRGECRR